MRARAKDELSANLHARLRWVMYVEKSICECDSKLLVYRESLKRMKKRLGIFEQVYEAPRMYVLAVLEVLRRRQFSEQFFAWTDTIHKNSMSARTEEIDKRTNFCHVFGNHFLQSLFPGLDQQPPPFAEQPPDPCDVNLPHVDVNDIKLLQNTVPSLMSELSLGHSLETSVMVREHLSQSYLSKLVDPRQNKTLEQTLDMRGRMRCDAAARLTMSVLHREISRDDASLNRSNPLSPTRSGQTTPSQQSRLHQWQTESLDDSLDDSMHASEFEPVSLPSLQEETRRMKTSDDSDAMFHSAELDFTSPIDITEHSPESHNSTTSSRQSSSPINIKSPKSSSGVRSRSLASTRSNSFYMRPCHSPTMRTTPCSSFCRRSPACSASTSRTATTTASGSALSLISHRSTRSSSRSPSLCASLCGLESWHWW